eukprot:XP_014049857.1 PREDICTED: poly [ADP-ribose] polymerase 14-like [Salmo salar]
MESTFSDAVHEYVSSAEQKLGEGIYFSGSVHGAERLWKGSADEEYLYFIEAQVLTGKSIVGCPGLIVPPAFARDPLTLYDSVNGGGDTWVIFNGHQALPEYLITCKKPTYVKPHALFNWGKAKKPQKNEDIVIEGREVDPAVFHISSKVDHWIKDLDLKEPESSSSPHDAVYLSESHRHRIHDMRIQEMLRKAREKESFNRNIKVASNMVDWQQQQPGGQYQRFHPIHNFHLQQALERKQPRVEVSVWGKMSQPIQVLPQHWDAMPANTSCLSCLIQPGSTEHKAVLKLFRATCRKKVIKIQRIQNPTLWRSLQIKKHDMELRNGHQKNEKRLFHGTCHTTINHINNHGFNRSFAGKNATAFGYGTYFAVGASYSARSTYSRPDLQGQKYMYLCRVLTGDFTAGRHGMTVPPAKSTTTVELYNSVTDNPSGPSMFVIFHDNQAYPEYLITFL